MRAALIYLDHARVGVREKMAASLDGLAGLQGAESYFVATVVPVHDGDYNELLAELEIYMTGDVTLSRAPSRLMVAGDLVAFDDGAVFLADVPDKWTQLDASQAARFQKLSGL